jgi:ribosomal protein L44E
VRRALVQKRQTYCQECADLTNLNVIHVRQLKRKDGYLKKYHENWEIAATLLNATTEHADKTQKECVDLIYKTTRVAQDTELS